MGETYRETALEQAVISHGKKQLHTTVFVGGAANSVPVIVDEPNNPLDIVHAARAYERFLNRPNNELEQHADALAAAIDQFDTLLPDTPWVCTEEGLAEFRTARDAYRRWQTEQAEPF